MIAFWTGLFLLPTGMLVPKYAIETWKLKTKHSMHSTSLLQSTDHRFFPLKECVSCSNARDGTARTRPVWCVCTRFCVSGVTLLEKRLAKTSSLLR